MQGTQVIFFKENGEGCRGVVIHFDKLEHQVVVQDEKGGEWIGKPEQVFKNEVGRRVNFGIHNQGGKYEN